MFPPTAEGEALPAPQAAELSPLPPCAPRPHMGAAYPVHTGSMCLTSELCPCKDEQGMDEGLHEQMN